ncbi:rhomboid family intramembrane serine protease [Christiangramia sp. OXR-203]|uniref:rhomboid family intramembrane serine protease n=1 Tax=Christiangramia sp. OXR-203 TaxID=3100176 RepID=UPI002AC98B36|nr:rhomboid family intramembrane serine protease [Christiangramia sp. OXR-203]WPY99119.1 rhomboid family intramembrane serine protease [Christiangramia sp. OXR-203]
MKPSSPFVFTSGTIGYPLLFVLMIWIVFWAELRFNLNLAPFGVRPGEAVGLRGIIFSPFIHSDIKHLFNNTIPLFILSLALFYFYRPLRWKVLLIGLVSTGLITWIIGRPANHIGASGIIYLLAAFLFFKGIFSKNYRLVALSLIVVFVYGGLIWYVTPIDPKISWEGHLAGLLSGLGLAVVFKEQIAKPPKYHWESSDFKDSDDLFMQHFDEEGNFVDNLPFQNMEEEETEYNYIYTEKSDDKN